MFCKLSLTYLFIYFSSNFLSISAFKGDEFSSMCDLLTKNDVPYDTLSPTNVETKRAKHILTKFPLVIQNALLSPFIVQNSGYYLEVIGNPEVPNTGAAYGGVLCNETFLFYRVRFYVNPDPKGRSFHTVDGKGTPITASLIYFNKKYGTYEEAREHRGGLVVADFPFGFTKYPNPLFFLVRLVLKYIVRKAGTQIPIPGLLIYAFFDRLPFLFSYNAMLGSYKDLDESGTVTQYQGVINILSRTIFPISEAQFLDSFAIMENSKGGTLNSTQALNPFNNRELLKVPGIVQSLTLL
ncbi:uncharacterized protein LOC135847993 [Planococcus citri]|uniref:uncharacterized protein LOC135847993 n=1 Tax=Planococcus citri TaxID=170843 RepID=UPI0031FA2AF3